MPNSCLPPTLNLPNSDIKSDADENADVYAADDADCAAADNDADHGEKADSGDDLSTAWEFLKDDALQQPVNPIPN